MAKRFWTADTHFGHANIAKYCNRPVINDGDLNEKNEWSSIESAMSVASRMNSLLIQKFNSRVKDEDTVICVGDFAHRGGVRGVKGFNHKHGWYLNKLNGNWFIVKGNHDPNNGIKYAPNFMEVKIGPYKVFVAHHPLENRGVFSNLLYEYAIRYTDFQITGHVHNAWKHKFLEHGKKKYLMYNVGVDVRKYMPITDDEIIPDIEKILKTLDN